MVESDTTHLKSYENVINPLTPVTVINQISIPNNKQHISATLNSDIQHNQQSQQNNFNSCSSTSSSSNGDTNSSGYKARQLITNGPQDFLYVSTHVDSGTTTEGSLNGETSSSSAVINGVVTTVVRQETPNNSLIQTSRICSKSYTKIPEIVGDASVKIRLNGEVKHQNQQQLPQSQNSSSKQKLTNNDSTNSYELTNIPMSKSVIVTASDKYNFNRMTMSSISRHNSKLETILKTKYVNCFK